MLVQGSAGQKRKVFYVLKKPYLDISYLYKKVGDRFYLKDDIKFLRRLMYLISRNKILKLARGPQFADP